MKKRIFILVIFCLMILMTGCTNDASEKEASSISKVLIRKKIIPKDSKKVGEYVDSYCPEWCYDYKYYILETTEGNLIGVNYQKIPIHKQEEQKCDFIVTVNKGVTKNPNYNENAINPTYSGNPYVTEEEYEEYENQKDEYILSNDDDSYCVKDYNFILFKIYKVKE